MSTSDGVHGLADDLRALFGPRLRALVQYDGAGSRAGTHTLAVVDALSPEDLRATAGKVSAWHDAHVATPLVLATHELEHSLDAFPLEFSAILASHKVLAGADPFVNLSVDPADLRRACELQARSHLLHVRQGFLETRGRPDALSELIVRSAAPFKALLDSIERLEGARPHVATGIAADVAALAGVKEMSSDEAQRIFPSYLAAVERLVAYVDGWSNQ